MADDRATAIAMLEEAVAFERTELYRRMAERRQQRREMLITQLIAVALTSTDLRLRAFAHQVQQANLEWAEFEEAKDEGRAVLNQQPADKPRSELMYDTL